MNIRHLTVRINTKANLYKTAESCLFVICVVSVLNSDAFS